jgi:hypothetical protein
MFPEFSLVSSALLQTYLDLINNGYGFINDNVSDSTTLNIYYFLCAHLVSISTQPFTGIINGPTGADRRIGDSAALVSLTFQQIEGLSIDQSFMNSTRYGQVFWLFSKQQYLNNFYLNVGRSVGWWGW